MHVWYGFRGSRWLWIRVRAYQLGLGVRDLAVILLQYFLQLLPLGFFFFLYGWHGAELAHEQATATTASPHRPAVQASQTHTHTHTVLTKQAQSSQNRLTHTESPTHNYFIAPQKGLLSITHMTTHGHSLQSTRIVFAVLPTMGSA